MKQISSIDLYFLVKELKKLENQRIDTFYYENETFYIKIYIRGEGHKFLTNKVSKYIYLGDEKDESSEPKSFVQYLRKYLKNGFIRKIELVKGERILKIQIEKKTTNEETKIFYLVLELFANGNIILTDKNDMILNSLQKKKFKDRTVMVRDTYELPPKREFSVFDIDVKSLQKEFNATELSIVKFLAIKFGMGGKFAEEICDMSNIDKNRSPATFSDDEIDELIKNLTELKDKQIKPFVVYDENDKVKDFIPFDFLSIKDIKKTLENFNEAIKAYYKQFEEEKDKKEVEFLNQLKKLKSRLEKQQKQKEEILENYKKLNNIGNKIYENYTTIDELLNSINKAGREKGWEHVLEIVKNNEKLKKIIKKINYNNNEIILNFE